MLCNSIIKDYPTGLKRVKKTKFNFHVTSELVKELEVETYGDDSSNNLCNYVHQLDLSNYEDFKKTLDEKEHQQYLLSKANDNLVKTKEKIYDIALSNEWNYFVTITFNSKNCDRFSFIETSQKIRNYLKNYRNRKDENLKYLLVHETHKNGAYHYHALIYVENHDYFIDSTHKDKKGRVVYNWIAWKNGFTTATKIEDQKATILYMLKYLNKDLEYEYIKGQRRFYYSNNCNKPIRSVSYNADVSNLDFAYETEFSVGYEGVIYNE